MNGVKIMSDGSRPLFLYPDTHTFRLFAPNSLTISYRPQTLWGRRSPHKFGGADLCEGDLRRQILVPKGLLQSPKGPAPPFLIYGDLPYGMNF